ncbi:MAG: hypothetical protein V2I43_27865 [Parvularcula sp.]|jgi:hypothetical protein|nr:hypothetical protein [Parvularcula sp.]
MIIANASPDAVRIGSSNDKLNHALAFAVLTPLAIWAFPRHSLVVVFLGLATFNALIEVAQAILEQGREADFADWLAGALVCAGLLVACALWRRFTRAAREPGGDSNVD